MLTTILFAASLATSDAPAVQGGASVDDPTALMGTWEVVEVTLGGKDESGMWKGEHYTFAGDAVRYPSGGKRIVVGLSRLDSITDDGRVETGVYSIAGDILVWTRQIDARDVRFAFRRVPK
jgi:hypothetical protein